VSGEAAPPAAVPDGLWLAIDTATRTSVVAIGRPEPRAVSLRVVRHRHGSFLLEQVDEVLEAAGAALGDVTALVVGTGPGSFTGLRVGLATAKTVAYTAGLPLVGVRSSDALRLAAMVAAGAPPEVAVVLAAGAHDHYLVRAGEDPALVPPGGLVAALAGRPALTVDLDDAPLGEAAARLGEAAVAGLPTALLALAAERLAIGETDDPALLVPAYVVLPRGVRRGAEDLGWSPDLR
jgi:tRNA threonylcarbamoyl adenosine modification protein YeaZ